MEWLNTTSVCGREQSRTSLPVPRRPLVDSRQEKPTSPLPANQKKEGKSICVVSRHIFSAVWVGDGDFAVLVGEEELG